MLTTIFEGDGGLWLFTLISDESALDIQSATGSGGGAEKLVRIYQMGRVIGVVDSIRATDATESLNSFLDAGTRATNSLKLVGLLADAQDTDSTSQEKASEAQLRARLKSAIIMMLRSGSKTLRAEDLMVVDYMSTLRFETQKRDRYISS